MRHFGDEFVPPPIFAGEPEAASERTSAHSSLLLLNHRTRLDWLFAFCLGRYSRSLKVSLKRELSTLPGVGWAMQLDGFIFLQRRIAVDLARIYQAVEYLLQMQGSAQVRVHLNLIGSSSRCRFSSSPRAQIPAHRD